MPSADDLEINRRVRKVFVKHWIDLGRLSIRTVAGKCFIRGALHKLPGVQDDLTPATLDLMTQEIRRICGRGQVRLEVENWSNSSGVWRPVGLEPLSPYPSIPTPRSGPGNNTYILRIPDDTSRTGTDEKAAPS